VVCDIATRKLLFRAPGVSHVDATSTAVGLRDQLRADGVKGFDLATGDLIRNLKAELNAFRERIKSAPGEVQVEHRPGYSGGGAIEAWFAGALAFLWITRWATHRKR